MTTIVGRQATFNPVQAGGLYYSDGIQIIEHKNPQYQDNVILGTVNEDRHTSVLMAGPTGLNGWYPLYLMNKANISLIETFTMLINPDQINGSN